MAPIGKFGCPKCYGNGMVTSVLEPGSGNELVCPRNRNHKYTVQEDGFLKSVKV